MNEKNAEIVREHVITREPFPNSKKVYVQGEIHKDIRVAMREISCSDTLSSKEDVAPEKNPSVLVYDTSGPYTDPNVEINVYKGLPALREEWIKSRNDVEDVDVANSLYTRTRASNPQLDKIRFEGTRQPLRAKEGKCVTQLHYAREGIITPEMEYIAIR